MSDQKSAKKKRLFILLGSGVIAAGIAMIIYLIHGIGRIETDDAYIEGRMHIIASKVPGTIKEIHVIDNQAVKKGDLLLEVDPVDYEVRVNEAQAALDAEKSRLLDADSGINTALANLQIQEIALNQAGLDKQRGEALFKDSVIPKEKYEKILTAYDLAVAQVKAANEQVQKARSFKDLEASMIKQREAVLKTTQLNAGYTRIYAPSEGYITKKSIEEGNQIQAGQSLMAVVALNDIWIAANYKETQLKGVRPGQRVEIKVDTFPGKIFTGKVDSIMAGTGAAFSLFPQENALGNYVKVVQRIPVKIILNKTTDNSHILRVGMSCVPTIIIKDE